MTTRALEPQPLVVDDPLTAAIAAPPEGPRDEVLRAASGGVAVVGRDAVTVASEGNRLVLTAATEIVLQVGQSTLLMRADGTILFNGRRMTLSAPAMLDLNPEAPGGASDAA